MATSLCFGCFSVEATLCVHRPSLALVTWSTSIAAHLCLLPWARRCAHFPNLTSLALVTWCIGNRHCCTRFFLLLPWAWCFSIHSKTMVTNNTFFYDKQHHTPQQSLILMRSLLSSRMSLASSFALSSPCLWPCHRHCLWHFRSASHLALSSLLSFGFVFALCEENAGTSTREVNSVATTWKIQVSRESVRSFPTPFPPAHCLKHKKKNLSFPNSARIVLRFVCWYVPLDSFRT